MMSNDVRHVSIPDRIHLCHRCTVQRFDHFAQDVLIALKQIRSEFLICNKVFVMGISMSGLVLLRTLELGCGNGQFGNGNQYVSGVVLLAPALSIKSIKAKAVNRLAMPIGKFLSKASPSARVAAMVSLQQSLHFHFPQQPNLRYYHIEQLCLIDPLVYKHRMRARLSMELGKRRPMDDGVG